MLTLSSGNKYYSEKEYESLLNRNRMLLDDIKTISNALRDEALQRDWCDEYNNFVEDVNENLKVSELQKLNKDYEVTITVTRTQEVTVTINVEDVDEHAARDYVNYLTVEEILAQCNEGEHNLDWENSDEDFDVTDVQHIGG